MVYRYKPKKRYSRYKKRYNNKSFNWASMAKKAFYGVRMLKGIVNSEKKTFTTTINANQNTTALVQCLNLMAQGDDYNLREGRSILAKSIEYKLLITANVASTANQYIRIVVFQDTTLDGTNTPTAGELISNVSSLRNPDPVYMKRFIILSDKQIYLSPNSGSGNLVCEYYKKLSHHIKFAGTGAVVGNMGEGSIWMILVSDQTTNVPNILGETRLRYYDN